MDVIGSKEIPEAELCAIIESKNGKFIVHAKDQNESWTTNSIDTIEEAWEYIRRWFGLRGVKVSNGLG